MRIRRNRVETVERDVMDFDVVIVGAGPLDWPPPAV